MCTCWYANAVGNYDDTTTMKFKALMRDADYGNQLGKLWILTITNDEILKLWKPVKYNAVCEQINYAVIPLVTVGITSSENTSKTCVSVRFTDMHS